MKMKYAICLRDYMKKKISKEAKLSSFAGTASGIGSIISVHNVCHSLCLGVAGLLSIFGIIISSSSLMFLQNYNMLFWGMGMFFLALSLFLLAKYPNCMPKHMIVINVGLLIIGLPFFQYAKFNFVFWVIGGLIALIGIAMWINKRWNK